MKIVIGLPLVCVLSISLVAQQPSTSPATQWSSDQVKSIVSEVRAGRKLTPERWPNNARVAVCLSFDVDNETPTLSGGGTAPVDLSAGEFGAATGLPRILRLLDEYGIPASFFIPAVSAMLHPEMIEEIKKRPRHEIGVHGWIHENLQSLNNASEEERLMNQAIAYLTQVTGKKPGRLSRPVVGFQPGIRSA